MYARSEDGAGFRSLLGGTLVEGERDSRAADLAVHLDALRTAASGQDAAAIQAAKNFFNMALAYYADGHSGALTESTLPKYHAGKDIDVQVTGSIYNDAVGNITTTDLTFKHSGSSRVHTLEENGDITSPP